MDTALSDPVVGRLVDGRYSVHRLLARGGMASVYLATDTRLDRQVAVKLLHPGLAEDPDFVARFEHEAQSAARLNHPNIVAVYDQGHGGGQPFLVMEYVPGQTLRAVLRERGRLSPAEAVAVMDRVLAGLAHAHTNGLVHRDVKPENVLLTPDSRVKVVDFGLARAAAGSGATRTLIGTPHYLAPEQISSGIADARSDVFASGVMLFELLTGAPPFRADTVESVTFRIVNEDVPAPSSVVPQVPEPLDDLVGAATARDADLRPPDARALHEALEQVRDFLGLHAAVPQARVVEPGADHDTLVVGTPTSRVGSSTRTIDVADAEVAPAATRRGRRKWPWILLALLLAAVAAGVAGWWLAVGRYTAAPSVVGLTRTAAIAKLHDAGLKAHWLPAVYSDSIDKDLVAKESPKPGSDVRRGGLVDLRLSLGKDHVPDVRRKSVDAARALLAKVQLTGNAKTTRYSDTVAKGLVITTSPKPGAVVSPGTDVTLIVSDGPAPVTVPDVTGKPLADATAILQGLGLKVASTQTWSDKVPAGTVISSSPAGGSDAHKGDTVTLTVSKGPQLYAVPDVRGMKAADAKRLLESQGFKADIFHIPGGFSDRVISQSPGGGSMKKRGTTVHLYVL